MKLVRWFEFDERVRGGLASSRPGRNALDPNCCSAAGEAKVRRVSGSSVLFWSPAPRGKQPKRLHLPESLVKLLPCPSFASCHAVGKDVDLTAYNSHEVVVEKLARVLPEQDEPICAVLRSASISRLAEQPASFINIGKQIVIESTTHKFPRRSCSSSSASNSALKLPLPNDCEPRRQMISKNSVGRSCSGLVKSCSK